jgi:DNA invertase Pin-like site-specific DNA recombinase
MVGAVIYVRVSTKEQTENLSLPTQLRACEEYCRRQGYEILERFHEESESAKTTDRSELQKLLTYCRLNKGRVHFVVVFNLTRFARDKYDHFALRSHLQSLGISLRSATEPIDDTSTGKLMEGVLAAFAQFDNDCRSDRTRAGMKAALELGQWTFLAPIGYLNAPRAMGKSLMADPGAGAACPPSVRGGRERALHEGAASQAGENLGLDEPPRPSPDIASDRHAVAEPALRCEDGRCRGRARQTQHSTANGQRRWRFANATPDPDFK